MREINFISETHLGDCIFTVDFLNKMIKLDDKIKVNYYIYEKHKSQIEELIEQPDKIRALNYSDAPKSSYRAWMAQYGQITYIPFDFNKLKIEFYKLLCNQYDLKNPYDNYLDLLFDHKDLSPINDNKWDLLVLNSDPLSNQLGSKFLDWETFLNNFKHKKIITTKKVEGVPCTLDYNYSIFDIAKLSLSVNKIVGVHTGPWHVIMNKKNYDAGKKFYYIDNNCYYTYDNCVKIDNLDIFK
jgi:hypothetical protein